MAGMVEIYLVNGYSTAHNCTSNFKNNRLIINSTIDPEYVIFEYDLKDVLKVVENGYTTYRSYIIKKFGDRTGAK